MRLIPFVPSERRLKEAICETVSPIGSTADRRGLLCFTGSAYQQIEHGPICSICTMLTSSL